MITVFVFVMGLISMTISIVLVYKKKIPEFPKIIGVLTSSTGSVIRDIINENIR